MKPLSNGMNRNENLQLHFSAGSGQLGVLFGGGGAGGQHPLRSQHGALEVRNLAPRDQAENKGPYCEGSVGLGSHTGQVGDFILPPSPAVLPIVGAGAFWETRSRPRWSVILKPSLLPGETPKLSIHHP